MPASVEGVNPPSEMKLPADGRGAQKKMSCKHDAHLAASTPGGVLESIYKSRELVIDQLPVLF